MENNLENTITSVQSNGSRYRKSIFTTKKSSQLNKEPTILLNGENLELEQKRVFKSDQNFYPLDVQSSIEQQKVFTRTLNSSSSGNINNNIIHIPARNNCIIRQSSPVITKCVRPVSLGRQTTSNIIYPQQQLPVYHPVHTNTTILSNSRVIPQKNILVQNSRVIPQSNFIVQRRNIIQQPKHMIIEKPIQLINIVSQPVNSRVIIKQTVPSVTKVIIQDDAKNISEINKLTLLNQFLNNQYSLTNNELNLIKQKIYQKQVIEDKMFLERSLNTIDNIFLSQTNQALHKLDQMTKTTTRTRNTLTKISSHKKIKQPMFQNNLYNNNDSSIGYNSPIKNVQNSRIEVYQLRY